MSKVLISCASMTAGGAERVLSILSIPLAEHYDEVTYILWVEAPIYYNIDERINIISIEKECGSKKELKKMIWFRKYIQKYRPDIVISFLTPYNMRVSLSLLGTNTNIIVAERNDPHLVPGGLLIALIRNILYSTVNGILVQTKHAACAFPVKLQRIIDVIYNPIIMDTSQVGSAIYSPKEDIIVSAGRLVPQKDQKTMIAAFHKFKQTHPSYRLIIYGDGPCRNELENYISELKLSDSVILPGIEKELWKNLLNAKVFVLSSKMEGMSNAMIEAMSLGLPVISTKVAGATELIRNGVNGYLINVGDSNQLTNLFSCLADNPPHAKALAQEAINIYDMLKYDTIIPQWITYINSKIKFNKYEEKHL